MKMVRISLPMTVNDLLKGGKRRHVGKKGEGETHRQLSNEFFKVPSRKWNGRKKWVGSQRTRLERFPFDPSRRLLRSRNR